MNDDKVWNGDKQSSTFVLEILSYCRILQIFFHKETTKGVTTFKAPAEHTAGITAQFFYGIAKFYFFFIG